MHRYSFIVFLLICFSFLSCTLHAANVEGFVYDETGLPLPYCNIYEKGTTNGCASNELGYYSIAMLPGEHTLIFQYIGYKKKEINISVANKDIQLTTSLELDIKQLEQVVISSARENPADEIMHSAIYKRAEHLKEVSSYSCEVYMKGMQKLIEAPDRILGVELNTIVDVDSNNAGVIYLSESVAKFYYQYPDKTKEVMVASKVSGSQDQFSWNDARSLQMEFYESFIPFEGFSQRGFVSPVADNAFFFYDYKLLGSFVEDGTFIYKIEVIPKRETDPVFFGTIYIRDNDFRIYSLDLTATKSQGIEFIDTFHVAQEFIKTTEDQWVLLSSKFEFTYGILGIRGTGYFNGFYKNYNLSPGFDDQFFGPEVSVVTDGANKQDSTYWNSTRPVPLTEEEVSDYHTKDSLEVIKESPAYKDSMDRIFNKFSPMDLIGGYNYRNSNQGIFINTSSLPEFIQFNTIEGVVIKPAFRIEKTFESKRHISFAPDFRYSFERNKLSLYASGNFTYDHLRESKISIRGGEKPSAYNPRGVSPFENSLYTIFLEKNLLKLYEKKFLNITHESEILNGLTFYSGVEMAERSQLFNYDPLEPVVDIKSRHFTSNNFPFYPDYSIVPDTRLLLFDLRLRYAPGQMYMTTPNEKYILDLKYPVMILQYKKAIPGVFHNSVNYDYLAFNIYDMVKLGLYGNFEYEVMTGAFIQHEKVDVEDMIHFAGNEDLLHFTASELWISSPTGFNYMLLPIYAASGTDPFYEQHLQWHTEGFMFNKLPLFKQLKLQPVFSFNYLYNQTIGNYFEIGAGIEHIFRIARVDFAYTPYRFDPKYVYATHYKIVIGLGF